MAGRRAVGGRIGQEILRVEVGFHRRSLRGIHLVKDDYFRDVADELLGSGAKAWKTIW